MWGILDTLGVARTLTALVGAIILVYGIRAYRATHKTSLLLFAAGMGTASAGYLLEGVLVQVARWDLSTATLIESIFSLVAFSLLAASLWVRDRPWLKAREPEHAPRPTSR